MKLFKKKKKTEKSKSNPIPNPVESKKERMAAEGRYFDVMSKAMENIPRNADGEITTEGFLTCFEGRTAKIYAIIFGGEGVLSSQLGGDLESNLKKIRRHYEMDPSSKESFEKMVAWEVATHGKDKLLKDKDNATKGILWLTRTLNFLCTLIEKLVEVKGETVKCARDTYQETLAPYHGWIGSTTFNGALGWISDVEKLKESFQYEGVDDFCAEGSKFTTLLRPIIDNNFAILTKNDVHFTYKVL